jgi:hypothetical protein
MRTRVEIENDIPKQIGFDDTWDLQGPRNIQQLLTLTLETLLDIREMLLKEEIK